MNKSYCKYIPPINFGAVEENIYRSGQPNELNFPFLEKLGLKTIIFLAAEEPNEKLYRRCLILERRLFLTKIFIYFNLEL
jgi:protein tyrosine/serine phosphatase